MTLSTNPLRLDPRSAGAAGQDGGNRDRISVGASFAGMLAELDDAATGGGEAEADATIPPVGPQAISELPSGRSGRSAPMPVEAKTVVDLIASAASTAGNATRPARDSVGLAGSGVPAEPSSASPPRHLLATISALVDNTTAYPAQTRMPLVPPDETALDAEASRPMPTRARPVMTTEPSDGGDTRGSAPREIGSDEGGRSTAGADEPTADSASLAATLFAPMIPSWRLPDASSASAPGSIASAATDSPSLLATSDRAVAFAAGREATASGLGRSQPGTSVPPSPAKTDGAAELPAAAAAPSPSDDLPSAPTIVQPSASSAPQPMPTLAVTVEGVQTFLAPQASIDLESRSAALAAPSDGTATDGTVVDLGRGDPDGTLPPLEASRGDASEVSTGVTKPSPRGRTPVPSAEREAMDLPRPPAEGSSESSSATATGTRSAEENGRPMPKGATIPSISVEPGTDKVAATVSALPQAEPAGTVAQAAALVASSSDPHGAVGQVASAVADLAAGTAAPRANGIGNQGPMAHARSMVLQLSPDGLGPVTIRLHVSSQGLDVHLTAANPATAVLLSRTRDDLASALTRERTDLQSLVVDAAGGARDAPIPADTGSGGAGTAPPDRSADGTGSAGMGGSRQGQAGQDGNGGGGKRQTSRTATAHDLGSSRGNDLYV